MIVRTHTHELSSLEKLFCKCSPGIESSLTLQLTHKMIFKIYIQPTANFIKIVILSKFEEICLLEFFIILSASLLC